MSCVFGNRGTLLRQRTDGEMQEKLNEAVMVLNKSLQVGTMIVFTVAWSTQLIRQQEINVQNMNVELVAQMFKNYQSNVLFHLEG
jgi:DASH complex subunit DAD4